MSSSTRAGKEVFFTEYEYETLAVVIDHDAESISVWRLAGDRWVEGNMDALYEGRKLYGAKESDFPPLPA